MNTSQLLQLVYVNIEGSSDALVAICSQSVSYYRIIGQT